MGAMDVYADISDLSLKKHGETLCGDQMKIVRMPGKTVVVLSDGLGSGVKACILATLTAEILVRMLKAGIDLADVIETVLGTLPVCKVRKVAYATFAVMEILHDDNSYKIINFDSPEAMIFHNHRVVRPRREEKRIHDLKIFTSEGRLEESDVVCLVSDGVLHAGLGNMMNLGWDWDHVAQHVQQRLEQGCACAWEATQDLLAETNARYGGKPGDDASIIGILIRRRSPLVVFTGPPLDPSENKAIIERFLGMEGRKVVCGGTTGNIVARHIHAEMRTDMSTRTKDVPPIGEIEGVDLVTEGIITLSKTLSLLEVCRFEAAELPAPRSGAVLLARELLNADVIHFMVGQTINEFNQNPDMSKHISMRRNLIKELAYMLTQQGKHVTVEYC